MAYLELSMEAYNDIIHAAGLKAGAVARVCEVRGVWNAVAQAEAPADVAVPPNADLVFKPTDSEAHVAKQAEPEATPAVEVEEVPAAQTDLAFADPPEVDEDDNPNDPQDMMV